MNEQAQPEQQPTEQHAFDAWCIAELFGHKRTAGRVSEVIVAGVGMLKIDVPNSEGPGFKTTDYFNPKAIYRLRPCTEAEARAAAKVIGDSPPVQPYELHALTAGDVPQPFRRDDGDPESDDEGDDCPY